MRGAQGKHPGDEASGMKGARASRRIDRAFLGRLAFGPGPIQGSWAGRLANGIGPGPMVPTNILFIYLFIACKRKGLFQPLREFLMEAKIML